MNRNRFATLAIVLVVVAILIACGVWYYELSKPRASGGINANAAQNVPASSSSLVTLTGTAYSMPTGIQYVGPAPTSAPLYGSILSFKSSPDLPSQQEVDAAHTWLSQNGFDVTNVPIDRMFISFDGTIGKVENAFHIQISSYLLGTRPCYASPDDQKIPQYLASFVSRVLFSECGAEQPGAF